MKNKIRLYAFVEGGMVMLLEITSALIAAPVLGASMTVWTLLICMSITSLALGYFLGSSLSFKNRKNEWAKINQLFTISALIISLGIIFSIITNRYNFIQDYYLTTYLILFTVLALPLVLLGATTPLLTSLYVGNGNNAGTATGYIYATSTLGGIVLAVLTGFFLLPEFGINSSLIAGLLLLSLLTFIHYLAEKKYKIPTVMGIALTVTLILNTGAGYNVNATMKSNIKIIDYQEGIMGQLLVADITREDDPSTTERILFINRMGQTWVNKSTGYSTWSYPNYITSLASIYPAKSKGLVLGLGGGIIAKQLSEINGFEVDGVELDERIISIAKKHFLLNPQLVDIYNDDARHFIKRSKKKYDFIVFDLFNGEVTPSHSLSIETFVETSKILNPGGVIVINFNGFIEGKEGLATRSICKTLKAAGLHVEIFPTNEKDIETRNILLIASLNPIELNKATIKVNTSDGEYLIHDHLLDQSKIDLNDAIIITDDRPQLEWINQASSRKWRNSYYKNFTLKLKNEIGVPLFK